MMFGCAVWPGCWRCISPAYSSCLSAHTGLCAPSPPADFSSAASPAAASAPCSNRSPSYPAAHNHTTSDALCFCKKLLHWVISSDLLLSDLSADRGAHPALHHSSSSSGHGTWGWTPAHYSHMTPQSTVRNTVSNNSSLHPAKIKVCLTKKL